MRCKLRRLGVIELERLGTQRLQALQGSGGLELEFFPGTDFFSGRHPQHIASFAHGQALGLQDDVQRLVPGHLLQAQGHRASNSIRADDVELGEIGNHLQQGAYIDVLKIKRYFFATEGRSGRPPWALGPQRCHIQHQLALGLVGGVGPGALGLHDQAHPVSRLAQADGLHWGGKVSHIHAPAQTFGQ